MEKITIEEVNGKLESTTTTAKICCRNADCDDKECVYNRANFGDCSRIQLALCDIEMNIAMCNKMKKLMTPAKERTAITPEQFAERMRSIYEEDGHDEETEHLNMDNYMCDVLRSLGYDEGVDIFDGTDKWYS